MLKADVIEWAERVVRPGRVPAAGYAVVVANPPYMGSGNMDAALWRVRSSATIPTASQTCFAMFIERCLQLVASRRLVGDDHYAVMDVPDDLRGASGADP